MNDNLLTNLQACCAKYAAATHLVDAFASGRREVSFAEVLDLSTRGADYIRERRPSEGPFHVGILAENSSWWIIAYYAVTGAGATAVPLDARQTEDEIIAIIRAAGVSVLLVSPNFGRFAERLAQTGVLRHTQVLDEAWREILKKVPPMDASPAGPESTASIIFTSGTTGRPKGVVLTHRNLLNQSWQNISAIGVDESSRLLAILPLNHIFVFVGLLSCLEAGSAVVFMDSLKPPRIVATLKEEKVTHLAGIPMLYDAFLKGIQLKVRAHGPLVHTIFRALWKAGGALNRLGGVRLSRRLFGSLHAEFAPSVQRFLCGGAKARPETIRGFLALGYEFQEGYGLTETTGGIIINPPDKTKVIGAVGRPYGDTEVRLHEATAGGEGEICIRGRSVFTGYYRDPEATADVMDAEGWFHTGDLGRLDPAGNLAITGRAKDIIVLASGKKFAPEELEFHFSRSPLLAEVAAVGAGPAGSERIHLVAVPAETVVRSNPADQVEGLIHREIERLSRTLPPYKRPQGMTVRLAALPRTTTRKIRRGELRQWLSQQDDSGGLLETGTGPALSLAEREVMASAEMGAIIEACSEALGEPLSADSLRPASSLYLDLGMDSIMILEVAAYLEATLKVKFPADGLNWAQTLGDLVDAVKAAGAVTDRETTGWRAAIRNVTAGLDGISLRPSLRRLARLLEPLDYGFIRFIGKVFYRLQSHNVTALPSGGPFILAPNHVSYFDYPAVAGTLPAAIRRQAYLIGKKEVYNNMLGRILSAIHRVIPVDRAGDALDALVSAARVLKSGKILYLHPEGTRSPTGQLQSFKNGVAVLACELGVPVVPVYIKGTYEVFPKGTRIPRLFHLRRWRRYPIEVFYGNPIDPAGVSREASPYQALLEQIHRTMEGMERQLRGGDTDTSPAG